MHIHLQLIGRESSLLWVKCSFVVCVCNLTVTSCQGCVFVFMDMHSVTSAYLFMHVGKNIGGYLESAALINIERLYRKLSIPFILSQTFDSMERSQSLRQ